MVVKEAVAVAVAVAAAVAVEEKEAVQSEFFMGI